MLNSYKIFQNESLNHCVYKFVAFFAIISEFTEFNHLYFEFHTRKLEFHTRKQVKDTM